MTVGEYKSIAIKKLKKRTEGQANVIHINYLEQGHQTLVRHMRHMDKIYRVQRLIRGFLGRMKAFYKRY